MRIETKKVRKGQHIGDEVWICHYLREDLNKKPLRNVPPTKVLIKSNEDLPSNKRVYYSETHFVPYSKKGKLLNKVISPVDNTGFRSREGNDLFVFTTEKECIEEWNKQIDECCERIKEKERSIVMELQEERMKLNNTKL